MHLLLFALLSAVPMSEPKVEAPERITIVGFVRVEHDPWAWGNDRKEIDLEGPKPHEWHICKLAFWSKSSYDEAIRNDRHCIHCRGFWVDMGDDAKAFVVESIQTVLPTEKEDARAEGLLP